MNNAELKSAVQALYDSRRRHDAFEPTWISPYFEEAGEDQLRSILASVARSPHMVTRITGDKHVQEDGFLIGTTTWIFMGRSHCTPVTHKGWVIIDRELSSEVKALERANALGKNQPTRFYMAYRVESPAYDIGPCLSLRETIAFIDG
jgi:hypothetical protein